MSWNDFEERALAVILMCAGVIMGIVCPIAFVSAIIAIAWRIATGW